MTMIFTFIGILACAVIVSGVCGFILVHIGEAMEEFFK